MILEFLGRRSILTEADLYSIGGLLLVSQCCYICKQQTNCVFGQCVYLQYNTPLGPDTVLVV